MAKPNPIPGPDLPAGRVWPPMSGRQMLAEAAPALASVRRTAGDEWRGHGEAWMVHSGSAGVYDDEASGHQALLSWANWHADRQRHLSPRCIALAPAEEGRWRLWQVVARVPTLADGLAGALPAARPETALAAVEDAIARLAALHGVLAPSGLRVGLTTAAVVDGAIVYAGFAPSPRGIALRPANFEARPLEVEREMRLLFESHTRLAASLHPEVRARLVAPEERNVPAEEAEATRSA